MSNDDKTNTKKIGEIYLNDLADFMQAHPAAKIVGTPNDAATWPRVVLPDAAATASAASGAGDGVTHE